jgi:hypothetical protein
MAAIQTAFARMLVRIAIWAAPADKARPLADATRPIWRPGAQ